MDNEYKDLLDGYIGQDTNSFCIGGIKHQGTIYFKDNCYYIFYPLINKDLSFRKIIIRDGLEYDILFYPVRYHKKSPRFLKIFKNNIDFDLNVQNIKEEEYGCLLIKSLSFEKYISTFQSSIKPASIRD